MAIGSAVGGIVGGMMQSNAAGKAADAQVEAANRAAETQLEMYYDAKDTMAPWRDTGQNALALLAKELGLGGRGGAPGGAGSAGATRMPSVKTITGDAPNRGIYETTNGFFNVIGSNGTFKTREDAEARIAAMAPKSYEVGGKTFANMAEAQAYARSQATTMPGTAGKAGDPYQTAFTSSPGYQFQLSEGNKAIERQMAASGLSGSGAMGRSLVSFGQGVAAQDYGNWMNRLASLAGVGQTSAAQTGQWGMATGQGIAGTQMAAGDARASGYINQANAWGGALQNVAFAGGQAKANGGWF